MTYLQEKIIQSSTVIIGELWVTWWKQKEGHRNLNREYIYSLANEMAGFPWKQGEKYIYYRFPFCYLHEQPIIPLLRSIDAYNQ